MKQNPPITLIKVDIKREYSMLCARSLSLLPAPLIRSEICRNNKRYPTSKQEKTFPYVKLKKQQDDFNLKFCIPYSAILPLQQAMGCLHHQTSEKQESEQLQRWIDVKVLLYTTNKTSICTIRQLYNNFHSISNTL